MLSFPYKMFNKIDKVLFVPFESQDDSERIAKGHLLAQYFFAVC